MWEFGLVPLRCEVESGAVPLGVAHAISAGVGTLAVMVIAMTFLRRPVPTRQTAGILLVIAGVALMDLGGRPH